MTTDDSIRILKRYQKWRRGEDQRTFDQTGLTPEEIGEAIDKLLSEITVLGRTLSSVTSQLAKCQVQREKFHSQLRQASSLKTEH